jgi:hypothetical protein
MNTNPTTTAADLKKAIQAAYGGWLYNNVGIKFQGAHIYAVEHACMNVAGGIRKVSIPVAKLPEFLDNDTIKSILDAPNLVATALGEYENRARVDVLLIRAVQDAIYNYRKYRRHFSRRRISRIRYF